METALFVAPLIIFMSLIGLFSLDYSCIYFLPLSVSLLALLWHTKPWASLQKLIQLVFITYLIKTLIKSVPLLQSDKKVYLLFAIQSVLRDFSFLWQLLGVCVLILWCFCTF